MHSGSVRRHQRGACLLTCLLWYVTCHRRCSTNAKLCAGYIIFRAGKDMLMLFTMHQMRPERTTARPFSKQTYEHGLVVNHMLGCVPGLLLATA
jgi:hypothetical protein